MRQKSSLATDSGDTDSEGFDSDAVAAWIAETATRNGLSEQALLDEILSSYWVLEELSSVLTASGVQGGPQQSGDQLPVETTASDQRTAPDHHADTASESTQEVTEIKSELRELRTTIEEISRDPPQADSGADDTETESKFMWVGQQVTVQSSVDTQQAATAETVDRLSERVTSLHGQVESVHDRIDRIESTLAADVSELDSTVQQLHTVQTEFEQRLETEFDAIEQVLEHLLETTDEIDSRVAAVSSARQKALTPFHERAARQDDLAALKDEALRQEVTAGVCANCDQQVDLGLLEKPRCPHCTRRFISITNGGWRPFSEPTLQTTDHSRQQRSK